MCAAIVLFFLMANLLLIAPNREHRIRRTLFTSTRFMPYVLIPSSSSFTDASLLRKGLHISAGIEEEKKFYDKRILSAGNIKYLQYRKPD